MTVLKFFFFFIFSFFQLQTLPELYKARSAAVVLDAVGVPFISWPDARRSADSEMPVPLHAASWWTTWKSKNHWDEKQLTSKPAIFNFSNRCEVG